MSHKIIKLRHELPNAVVEKMAEDHQVASAEDYDYVVTDYTTVLKPNGEVLLKLLPRSLNLGYTEQAFKSFHGKLYDKDHSFRAAVKTSPGRGSEGVYGFMEASYPFTYCRSTAFTRRDLEAFKLAYPFIRSAAELMKQHMPDRYGAQLIACDQVHPDYIITGTPFSTLTVNEDVTVTYHTDQGDYKQGIGIIAATWAARVEKGWQVRLENSAEGGLLVFPKYRVAVQLRSTDLLLADVHEVHGVTAIVGEPGSWTRLSFVFYLREKMYTCDSMNEEMEKVALKDEDKHK